MDDFWRKEEKLAWLRDNPISKIAFESITPDEKHNWINQTDNDFDTLIPVASKDSKSPRQDNTAIFKLFSLGFITARDEWVYDYDRQKLESKIQHFIEIYEIKRLAFHGLSQADRGEILASSDQLNQFLNTEIKFSRELVSRDFLKNKQIRFDRQKIINAAFRPFTKKYNYFDSEHRIIHETYQNVQLFGKFGTNENRLICFNVNGLDTKALATRTIPDYHFVGDSQCLPLFRYDSDGIRQDNITDWAVEEFARRGARGLTKEDIFHYVYAVLHYPPYREKYEQNLKREFPRIPVYEDALEWARLGKELMELHLNYETVEPFALIQKEVEPMRRKAETRPVGSVPLFQVDLSTSKDDTLTTAPVSAFIPKPTTKLRADKEAGVIEIDSHTSLEGVPAIAWEYKLGNRSALEWVLDQYKERKPKDPTIAEKFNTYKFADYKDHVIDLLKRVCTVSVKTMEIVKSMPEDPSQNRER